MNSLRSLTLTTWLNRIRCRSDRGDTMIEIKVKYMDGTKEIFQAHEGEWYDLRSAVDIHFVEGMYFKIPLGVAMELPEGYEAHVVPRSSTFQKFGIIMTNSVGIIDHAYCGDNDWWQFPALGTRDRWIHKDARIAQFRIVEVQPKIKITKVDSLGNEDRNGFGSSGTI